MTVDRTRRAVLPEAVAGSEPVDAVFVLPEHERLVFVVRSEQDVPLGVLDLAERPTRRQFVVEVVTEVERVTPVIEDTDRRGELDPLEVADLALVEQPLCRPNRVAEPALVVERQLDVVSVRLLGHRASAAVAVGHRLLTVNRVDDARADTVDRDRVVDRRRNAHRDDIRLGRLEHHVVLLEDAIVVDSKLRGERLGVLTDDVGTGDQCTPLRRRTLRRGDRPSRTRRRLARPVPPQCR